MKIESKKLPEHCSILLIVIILKEKLRVWQKQQQITATCIYSSSLLIRTSYITGNDFLRAHSETNHFLQLSFHIYYLCISCSTPLRFPLPFFVQKKQSNTLYSFRKKQVLRMYATEKHTLLKIHPRINNTLRWLVSHLSFRCRLYSLPVHFFSFFSFFDLKRVL